jgi:hypothetical protein
MDRGSSMPPNSEHLKRFDEMRDLEARPYTPDELRVARYLVELTGIGAGDDPIGFLIVSHRTIVDERKKYLGLCESK